MRKDAIRVARRKSDGRLMQVLRAKDDKVRVRLLNRQKAEWIDNNKLKIMIRPEPGVYMRMTKPVEFDQECGCTAVVEFKNGEFETFNVYGDMSKYIESGLRKGLTDTPYYRRKFLSENGFVRSKGMAHKAKGDHKLKKIRQFERKGYAAQVG